MTSAEDACLFRHALLRDAAYQLHLPGDRARLHALALDLIEALYGGRAPEPQPLFSAAAHPHSLPPEHWNTINPASVLHAGQNFRPRTERKYRPQSGLKMPDNSGPCRTLR
jgi:hypothetical protein